MKGKLSNCYVTSQDTKVDKYEGKLGQSGLPDNRVKIKQTISRDCRVSNPTNESDKEQNDSVQDEKEVIEDENKSLETDGEHKDQSMERLMESFRAYISGNKR